MRIGPPRSARERADALACLFCRDESPSDRVQEALCLAEAGEIDLSGLIAAWCGGDAIAAGLFAVAPDRTAFMWPPEVREGASKANEAAVAILKEMARRSDEIGCPYSQAAVRTEHSCQGRLLEEAGFSYLADLIQLQRSLDRDLPLVQSCDGSVKGVFEADESRITRLIERTYVDSQDCPGFVGYRSAAEALASYRLSGEFTPERWQFVEQSGDDVAILLVNDRPEVRAREVLYVGVVPERRGHGLAAQLIASALAEAAVAGCDSMISAVDAANSPAVRLYAQLGFFSSGRHAVYVRRRSR